jgi:hypothetical protein
MAKQARHLGARRHARTVVAIIAISAGAVVVAPGQADAHPKGAPTITTQPASTTVAAGGTATFTAGASGTPPPTVQWQVCPSDGSNCNPLTGATSTTLTLTGVRLSMSGNRYRAQFRNNFGTALTSSALLTVVSQAAPTITTQPTNVKTAAGSTATFTAAATGSPTPTVHWQEQAAGGSGNSPVPGATSPTLTLTAVTASMSGTTYEAVFTNSVSSATTNPATLTVEMLDHLVLSPASATVGSGVGQAFTAEGYGATGDDLGPVTSATTFSISPDGSCLGSTCSASASGSHTVTGVDGSASGTATLSVTAQAQKYVELLFSRTEVTATDGGCVADDANIARLDTTVEPYLQSLGLAATGSIETGPTQATSFWCAHYGLTMATSWAVAQQLATKGWTFVSHSLDYPLDWSSLTPGQKWDETCGSAQTIDAQGLPGGDNMFLWPNNLVDSQALTSFVEPCFGTNRIDGAGITSGTQLSAPPYQQSVHGLAGGFCNVPGAPCATVPGASFQYRTPAKIIALIQSLKPGQVLSLQVYLTVTGTSPAYSTNTDRWDCTAADPNYHWTNDTERYCWNDLQTVLQYLASSGLGITQPGAVNAAFGRTGYSDHAVVRPS